MGAALDPVGGGGGRRRYGGGQRFRARAEINVTPFVDVMLVLLIVFMVTAPLLTVGELVDLPNTRSDSLPADDEPLAITVTAEGTVLIQETEIALEELGPRLVAVAAAGGKTAEDTIYIYGDDVTDYGDIIRTMVTVRDAGFPKFALVTDPVSQVAEEP